jgi:hypothetical protein
LVRLADLDTTSGLQSLDLDGWMEENALGARTDVTVYSPDGGLLATSQPALFENQLIATRMDRQAWRRIVLNHEAEAVTSEEIGKLQYSCAYSAIRSPETIEGLGKVDILFIPVGGNKFYLDAPAATELINEIEPRIIIPIAYECDTDPNAAPVSVFIKEIGLKSETSDKKLIIKAKDLPQEEMKVITLEKA